MPFIDTKTNVKITEEKERELTRKIGEAITLIPGKSERWLMLNFSDECRMAFAGDFSPTAILEVKLFGAADERSYENLTRSLTDIVNAELSIPKSRIYIKYEEITTWGYGGENC